jgi:hypothetical protein
MKKAKTSVLDIFEGSQMRKPPYIMTEIMGSY